MLIKAEAEDTSNKNAETALMLAERYNNPEVVLALVKAGADETAKSRTGETALSLAKQRGDYGVINALFDFQELCEKGSPEEILKAIQAGARLSDSSTADDEEETALSLDVRHNSLDVINVLLNVHAYTLRTISFYDDEK